MHIYNPRLRRAVGLEPADIAEVKKDESHKIELSGFSQPVYILERNLADKYRDWLRNEDSEIAVDEEGYIVEVLHEDTEILIFDVTIGLVLPEIRELFEMFFIP